MRVCTTFTIMENEQKVIGVLAGGYSSERDISLASGKTALQAFEEAGYQGYVVLEYEEEAPREKVPEYIDLLKKIINPS